MSTINGHLISNLELHVPAYGPWFCYVTLANEIVGYKQSDVKLSGKAKIVIDYSAEGGTPSLILNGTINNLYSNGVLLPRYLVVGGNGWGNICTSKDYHNDAGVSAYKVLSELASEVGEQILEKFPGTLNHDYIRKSGFASQVLDDICEKLSTRWYVDYSGQTYISARKFTTPPQKDYNFIDYNPENKIADLYIYNLSTVTIGSHIQNSQLLKPVVITELVHVQEGDTFKTRAVCNDFTVLNPGASDKFRISNNSGLANVMEDIVKKLAVDKNIFGKYRYRVISQTSDGRLNLQVVNKNAKLPDLLLIENCNVSGVHVEYSPGAIVTVEFLEGDPSLPMVTGTLNINGSYKPKEIVFNADKDEHGGVELAYKGSVCDILLPPLQITGTVIINGQGQPLSGVAMSVTAKTLGTVSTGLPKVKGRF